MALTAEQINELKTSVEVIIQSNITTYRDPEGSYDGEDCAAEQIVELIVSEYELEPIGK